MDGGAGEGDDAVARSKVDLQQRAGTGGFAAAKNAKFVGVGREQATGELDRRDEAWHARRAFALAAELAGDPATLARALAGRIGAPFGWRS